MNFKEIVERTTKFFKEKNIESARLDSEILISSALGLRRIDLYLKFEQPLNEEELEKCRSFVRRRAQGEPVAYILGQKDFYNLTFEVDSSVLIPRPETETLVEAAIDWIKLKNMTAYQAVDLGSGSGCIGLTIAKNEPRAQVAMVEASEKAFERLCKNREALHLEKNTTCVHSRVQDHAFVENSVDLVVANPPYISSSDSLVEANVRKFEPAAALFAEDDGMREIVQWSKHMAPCLKKPGLMIFEIGWQQGKAAKSQFESLGIFDQVFIKQDLSGRDRFVVGERL